MVQLAEPADTLLSVGEELPAPRRRLLAAGLETLAVLASPAVLFYLLRLRAMSPIQPPDPMFHTAFIVHPRDMYARYPSPLPGRPPFREGARVGFILLGRVFYLLFGSVPGFLVTRYVLVLVAIVPLYVLLKRLYSFAAGALGIVIFFSAPVVITALGTDYPSSAVICYVTGGLACLAMPRQDRWRRAWIALGGALLVLAAWSHGMGILIAATTVVVYVLVRLLRERRKLLGDLALLAGVATAVTALLMVGAGLLLGHFDFIVPTWNAFRYLSTHKEQSLWHSANWRWAPYVAYLLVPPAVLGAWLVTFGRRWRQIRTPQLFIGVACAAQLVVFVYEQFFGHLQALEIHYFSSTLWAVVCVTLSVVLAEVALPLLGHRVARWLPAALLIVVVLVYEAGPSVPAFGWLPVGAAIGALLVIVAGAGRLARSALSVVRSRLAAGIALVVVAGCALVLTVAPIPVHRQLPGTVADPPPAYATALGGSATKLIAEYRIMADLAVFVGNPNYRGQPLLIWVAPAVSQEVNEPINGLWYFPPLVQSLPVVSRADGSFLALPTLKGRPVELLMVGLTLDELRSAALTLGTYRTSVAAPCFCARVILPFALGLSTCGLMRGFCGPDRVTCAADVRAAPGQTGSTTASHDQSRTRIAPHETSRWGDHISVLRDWLRSCAVTGVVSL